MQDQLPAETSHVNERQSEFYCIGIGKMLSSSLVNILTLFWCKESLLIVPQRGPMDPQVPSWKRIRHYAVACIKTEQYYIHQEQPIPAIIHTECVSIILPLLAHLDFSYKCKQKDIMSS